MKHQLTTESDHEKDQNDAISQRSPMRDTCNQSEKKKELRWSSELGEEEKKADAAKKKDLQREIGLKTQERELREHLSS